MSFDPSEIAEIFVELSEREPTRREFSTGRYSAINAGFSIRTGPEYLKHWMAANADHRREYLRVYYARPDVRARLAAAARRRYAAKGRARTAAARRAA